MTPESVVPVPAWVCAPGVRRVPFLPAFLPEYALGAAPGADTAAVLGWGLKRTAAAGRAWARARSIPYVALEDGFLRSVGLGETGAASLSLIVDDLGVYYDATRPSRLEALILDAPDWMTPALEARARALVDRIVEAGVSKTNMGGPLDRSLLQPGRRRVLVVDQTLGDASIEYGLASSASFDAMVAAALADEPDAQILVKRHPAVAAGRKQGCIGPGDLDKVTLIDADVRPADLLAEVDAVYTVTSLLGFEALLRGLPVRCFGAPFYAGWGLTRDEVDTGRRGVPRSLEAVAAAALLRYSRYVDPVTGRPCEAEAALSRLIALRARTERLAGFTAAVGFAPWKHAPVRRLLNSARGEVRYFASPARAAAAARDRSGRVIYWAARESPELLAGLSGFDGPVLRMEDGFIRSRGLGSDFFGALSVSLDDLGVYYDATAPSRLEVLLQTAEFPQDQLARAAALRERIVGARLSKYNLPSRGDAFTGWPADRERVLVVGQVENDKSILKGCEDVRTNGALVAAARAAHPDAFLIFKNHPDVLAGNRPGRLGPDALAAVDALADGLDIVDCLDHVDVLATMTSLSGFEALLRGLRVETWGRPFYAGWGLTHDRLDFPRRTRRLHLDQLVAGALIAYPIYVSALTGWPCEVEDVLDQLDAARGSDAPVRPAGGLARFLKGVAASLDRRPPPAY